MKQLFTFSEANVLCIKEVTSIRDFAQWRMQIRNLEKGGTEGKFQNTQNKHRNVVSDKM